MPSPRKSSKSPARTRGRPKSPSRTKVTTRSRSRSAGRQPKSVVSKNTVLEEEKIVRKLPTRHTRSISKSPPRPTIKEGSVTKRIVTSTVFSSVSLSASTSTHGQALTTPVRKLSVIDSLIEKEKQESLRQREQLKLELLSQISTPSLKAEDQAESKEVHYEFMGPFGALLLIVLLPAVLYYVNCVCLQDKLSPHSSICRLASIFEVEAMLAVLAWFFFQALLAVLPVGRVVKGQPLKSGDRLKYRCNGLLALCISLLLLVAAVYFKFPVTKVIDKYNKLMVAAIIFSFILSICLFISSRFVSEKKLSPAGNTGNPIYDFFMGRELNPRVGMLDLKFFCELRPGMIGWVILDWIMVIKACQETTSFPSNLVLVTIFQTVYVVDAFWFEDGFLTTLEIVQDGFGFMLSFGCLAWMPFFYSIQPRYILLNSYTLPWYCLTPITLIFLTGFAIYRLSSLQKQRFKSDPNHPAVSELETLSSKTNGRLLVSGWWGICRKPNYLGDLIIALSWSLTAGFGHIVTYFYLIYMLMYLVHRERRDSEKCQKKYGAIWDRYCERVQYRIFPYIY